MRALAIARASGRRVLRDRTALFFLIVLPIVLIVIVGAVEVLSKPISPETLFERIKGGLP